MHTGEMYYSDDEEERQAKNRRKSKGASNEAQRGAPLSEQPSRQRTERSLPSSLPSGFHQAPSAENQSRPSAPLPQGFHHPSPASLVSRRPPNGMTPMVYRYNAPGQSNGPPPPPPPPGRAPPPPPPPAYQY